MAGQLVSAPVPSQAELEELAGGPVEWVEPPKPAVLAMRPPERPETLRPARMLRIDGMYLVETLDEPGTWFMGEENEGVVQCWGGYGDLRNAIRGL
jgi:hypothetical protein